MLRRLAAPGARRGRALGLRQVLAWSAQGSRPRCGARRGSSSSPRAPIRWRARRAVACRAPAPMLVVDQCEEVFTLCHDPAERHGSSPRSSRARDDRPVVLSAARGPAGRRLAPPAFARLVERGLYLLGAMAEADLRAAIEAPPARPVCCIEPGLVDLLCPRVEGEPGALPLLSHALHRDLGAPRGPYPHRGRLPRDRRHPGRGRPVGRADLRRTSADDQRVLRDLMLRLVAPSADGEPVRSRVPRRLAGPTRTHDG